MKKKNKKIAALSLAVLVAGTGAFHAYGNYQQSGVSDALLNENVEGFATCENEPGQNNGHCTQSGYSGACVRISWYEFWKNRDCVQGWDV